MHITTKALVLRGVDYKESDKVLTLPLKRLMAITKDYVKEKFGQ